MGYNVLIEVKKDLKGYFAYVMVWFVSQPTTRYGALHFLKLTSYVIIEKTWKNVILKFTIHMYAYVCKKKKKKKSPAISFKLKQHE